MTEDNQFEVPSAFPVCGAARASRAGAPATADIKQRYELCEDLATHLQGFCEVNQMRLRLNREECLRRCHAGLLEPDAGVHADEARWIVERVAELLGWRCPPLDDAAPG